MKSGKIFIGVALSAALVFGSGLAVKPAAAQSGVACPTGYYYLPGTGANSSARQLSTIHSSIILTATRNHISLPRLLIRITRLMPLSEVQGSGAVCDAKKSPAERG